MAGDLERLAEERCDACNRLTPRLEMDEAQLLIGRLNPGWSIIWMARHSVLGSNHLKKSWMFKGYADAFEFVSRISVIADQVNHHPDIKFGWGYVEVAITTHAIRALSRNDFAVAAKIDLAAKELGL